MRVEPCFPNAKSPEFLRRFRLFCYRFRVGKCRIGSHEGSVFWLRSTRFTLVELVVVIGIITVLIALLLPSLARVRYHAQIAACASNLGQISLAINAYATSNEGRFPNLDITSATTGGNLWDVSHEFSNALLEHGVKVKSFICPLTAEPDDVLARFDEYSYFNIIAYSVWIPRLNGPGKDIIPPEPTTAGSRFIIAQPVPTASFAGPNKLTDLIRMNNPIICDVALSNGVTPPSNADAGGAGNPYGLNLSHAIGGRFTGVNQGFADGHVEVYGVENLKPYFYGTQWNWR